MTQAKAFILIQEMKKRLGNSKWANMISELKRKADRDDNEQVFVDDFAEVLRKFKVKVN